ncbi:MAG: tyrosine-type recombinase/integrase [Methylophilaceae bacterium]|nr:tyrosine-type recombinase/integrase [Methylophilaceae bacterium]
MANRFRFTKTSLEKLPLPAGTSRITYYDQDIGKLALRVTAAGAKSFYIVKRVAGEMVWYKLGTFPEMTVEQARKAAEVTLGNFANEDNPAVVRRAIKGIPTLNEFFIEYGERHGVKKLAWESDQQRFRDYLKDSLGARKLNLITREMIGRILTDMDMRGKAGATINNVRALASGIFAKAIEWGYIKDNPVRGIKTRKAIKRDRFMSAHELPRFFKSVAEEPNTTVRDYFLIALLTGARRANVVAMKWTEIDFKEGIWRIAVTKNGDPQNVTLSPEALTLLEQRKELNKEAAVPSSFVFPGTGATGHLVEPKKGWKRIFDRDEITQLDLLITSAGGTLLQDTTETEDDESKADSLESTLTRARALAVDLGIDTDNVRIPDLRIHDLRRTLGSWQAKTGASLAIIGKSLNHKNQSTTAIYARLDLDPVRASVNTATTAMMEAGGLKLNTHTGKKHD